jgi:hypothetical protein
MARKATEIHKKNVLACDELAMSIMSRKSK